jgi:hypothetical protein
LRALNVALNLDIAKQRLNAALTLFNRFRDTRVDLQIKLLQLADAELVDAREVLATGKVTQPFYPVAVDRIDLARSEIVAALAAPASSRGGKISNAVSRVENARDQIGANVTFQLGQGNLFFWRAAGASRADARRRAPRAPARRGRRRRGSRVRRRRGRPRRRRAASSPGW